MHARDRITTLEANGPPPAEAGALYLGEVMHARLTPFGHRFNYRVFSLLVDVDRLDELDAMASLLSVNKGNVVSFHEDDHVEAKGESLRAFADRLLRDAGIAKPAARILLLSYPRVLGYAFNPISVFFAYDEANRVIALAYAVRNTFGGRHIYVAPVEAGQVSSAGVRQSRAKNLHVSPFIGMDARYDFRVLPPGRSVRLRIHETEEGKPLLSAAFRGEARPVDSTSVLGCLLKFPLMTWKIIAGIHWEALKLWVKGARFRTSPPDPELASFRDTPESPRLRS